MVFQPLPVVDQTALSLTQSYVSPWYSCCDTQFVSFQANISGGTSPTGTLSVEASCDLGTPTINFSPITGLSQAITTNGVTIFNMSSASYNWVRFRYAFVSGTGSLNLTFNKKVQYRG